MSCSSSLAGGCCLLHAAVQQDSVMNSCLTMNHLNSSFSRLKAEFSEPILGNPGPFPPLRRTRPGSGSPTRFASPRVKAPDLKRNTWRFVGMLYCPPFSTVYNIFLCLHIFSVHITHQNKKRNYENDQLSYDNKRGPKVYLHGQCTPPTNFPNVATRNRARAVWSPAEPELSLSW